MKRVLVFVLCICVIAAVTPKAFSAQPLNQTEQPQQKAIEAAKTSSKGPRNETTSDAEKARRKVQALGVASRVTVELRNGNEYYGAISTIQDDSFELAEIDLKQQISIRFGDVKKVRSGFGTANPYTGKRWHPRWKIASTVALISVTVLLVFAGATARD